MQYAAKFENLTGQDARIESSFAYDAVWAIALALDQVSKLLNQQGNVVDIRKISLLLKEKDSKSF